MRLEGAAIDDTGALVRSGVAAARNGDVAVAEGWYRAAAERGDVAGMTLLALICEERGEVAEARHWYARASSCDDPSAMQGLARLARLRGRPDESRRWYRRAADLGDTDAMVALAESTPSGASSSDSWYRRAAELGNPRALAVISTRLQERGEFEEAERWLRRAVETTGEPFFMVELGHVLAHRGEAAEPWYRRAAEAGDVGAMAHLGAVLVAGSQDEAVRWYRMSAEAGRTSAMTALAVLLVHRGEVEEAERWLARASDASGVEVDHALWTSLPALEADELGAREERAGARVLVVLGVLAQRRGDVDRAERCFLRAADSGDTQAMYEMGMLLIRWGGASSRAAGTPPFRPLRRDDLSREQPETWFLRAAEAGHPDAMFSLSVLHKGSVKGELWWERAIEATGAVRAVEP
ncbi:tetratricopeptide repeat protein [Saccharothrix isguenensis]